MGYARAGFDIVGIDIDPQPNYPFTFHQADALEWLRICDVSQFDAIHASPPCQSYSTTRSLHDNHYEDLVAPTRDALDATGLPWVIENVVGAPLRNAVLLCGSSFGLGVRRHRLFETKPIIIGAPQCAHWDQPEPVDVTGTGGMRAGARPDGKGGNSRKPRNIEHARAVMGIDWMTRRELNLAIPPVYTEWIGRQLAAFLRARCSSST